MGDVVDAGKIREQDLKNCSCPIIVVNTTPRVERMLTGVFEDVTVNLQLANRLLSYSKGLRNSYALSETDKVIGIDSFPIYIENYEMLFTPSYNIDVIGYFCNLSRKRKVAVKWCGELQGDVLIYSNAENEDYRCYDIKSYDVLCIK